jgi:protein gp37
MGTTVDLQARVANAEAAFARLNKEAGIRWLSVEPMLEPVKFNKLELFNWVVIGGASRSEKTPVFQPPLPWIIDLYTQAKNAGCAVYMKTNLLGNRVLELPFNAAIKGDPTSAPEPFHYLGKPELAA